MIASLQFYSNPKYYSHETFIVVYILLSKYTNSEHLSFNHILKIKEENLLDHLMTDPFQLE